MRKITKGKGGSFDQYTVSSKDGTQLFIFDVNGRHLETRNTKTGAILLTFQYTDDQLSSITDADNNVTNIVRYGETGFDIVAPFGQITEVRYDGNGYIHTISNPADEIFTATHDASGLLRSFELPNGLSSIMDYDDQGRLILDYNSEGNSWELSEETSKHQNQVTMTSALGRSTVHKIEDLGEGAFRRTITLPSGAINSSALLSDGSFEQILANGTSTTGNLTPDPRFGMQAPLNGFNETILPSGLQKTVVHTRALLPDDWRRIDGIDTIQEIIDTVTFNGNEYTSTFNVPQNLKTSESPLGRTQETLYDDIGRVKEIRIPGLETTFFSYDANGRLRSVVQGSGANTRSQTYDYSSDTGYLNSITHEDASWVSFSAYDLAGRPHTQSFSDGRTVGYDYSPMGDVSEIQPPGKPPYEYIYTGTSLIADDFLPILGSLNRQTHYEYDLDKNLSRIDRIDGSSINYNYHTDTGQLENISWDGLVYSFGYDPLSGQLASSSSPYGVDLIFAYDGKLQDMEQWTGAVTGTVNFHINDLFQLSGTDINGSLLVEYGYDGDGLLISAGSLSYTLDPLNGLLTQTNQLNVSTTLVPNGFGEVDSYTAQYGANTLYSYQVTARDSKGRIKDLSETIQGVSTNRQYDYDGADRLWRVYENGLLLREYDFDLNGNRTHVNGVLLGVYDDRDRLNAYDGILYSYYDTGELATKTQGPSITRYDHDAFNNLVEVVLPGGTKITYLPDSKGRRVSKSVDGVKVQAFLYRDNLNPIAELDASNNIVSRFVYGSKAYVPDYMIKGGQTYRIISDHLGSVRLVVNSNSGAVAQRLDYDEYGNVLADTNPGFQPFAYAGGLYDVDTGLVRFGARDYDASVGRWVQSDPIGLDGGLNTYGYVHGDPIQYTDPNGLAIQTVSIPAGTVVGAIGGAIGAGVGTAMNPNSTAGDIVSAMATGLWQGAIIGAAAGACGGCWGGG